MADVGTATVDDAVPFLLREGGPLSFELQPVILLPLLSVLVGFGPILRVFHSLLVLLPLRASRALFRFRAILGPRCPFGSGRRHILGNCALLTVGPTCWHLSEQYFAFERRRLMSTWQTAHVRISNPSSTQCEPWTTIGNTPNAERSCGYYSESGGEAIPAGERRRTVRPQLVQPSGDQRREVPARLPEGRRGPVGSRRYATVTQPETSRGGGSRPVPVRNQGAP